MERVLESIPVTRVPLIMVIEKGEISAEFMGEHAIEQLKEYISEKA